MNLFELLGGPLADGRAFARWLARRRELSDAARPAVLAVDLRYATVTGGLRPRRGPALVIGRLRRPWLIVIGLRWPWLGERWFSIPPV
jgi:hypothetical protein